MNRIKSYISMALAGLILTALSLEAREMDRYAAAYLRTPIHARATGMGGAYTAVARDAAAAWWNPAGLAFVPRTELDGTYAIMTLDRVHNYAALALPSKDGLALAIHALQYGATEIDGRDAAGVPTDLFAAQQYAAGISFAFRLDKYISFGATAKYLRQEIDKRTASGYAIDAGFQFNVNQLVFVGGTAHNIGGELKWDSDAGTIEYPYPFYRAGVGIRPLSKLMLSVDALKFEMEEKISFCEGVEWWFKPEVLAVRAGHTDGHLTAGASLGFQTGDIDFRLDYAYLPDLLEQGATSQLSCILSF